MGRYFPPIHFHSASESHLFSFPVTCSGINTDEASKKHLYTVQLPSCLIYFVDVSWKSFHQNLVAHGFTNCHFLCKNYCLFVKNHGVLYDHVTVHRNKFLFNKTNRHTNFPNLFFQESVHVSGSSSAHHQEFIH